MIILGIDLETTGLDTKNDRITEIGYCLWDTDKHKPVSVVNQYMWEDGYPELTKEIIELTGIEPSYLENFGRSPKRCLCELDYHLKYADYIVAHNGNRFDKPILMNEYERQGLEPPAVKWLDTTVDIEYPTPTRKLVHLAAEHNFVNPFAHRAIFDVLTMLNVVSNYNFNKIVENSTAPKIKIMAVVAKPFGKTEEQGKREVAIAKENGFRWDGANKIWVKTIFARDLEKEKKGPLPIREV